MIADKIIYFDEAGLRALDLRPDGVDCIPLIGFSNFPAIRKSYGLHYHPGCMEFCLCLKGNLAFTTEDRKYPFLPNHIFVSAPHEPHHLCDNPKGLKVYHFLFKLPKGKQRILGLDHSGSKWLVHSLTHLPNRLFSSIPEVAAAFGKIFHLYDNLKHRSPARKVMMQSAALDLLLSIINASRRPPIKPRRIIVEISDRIREQPNAKYSLSQLANEANLSTSAFATAFKQAKGLPLHAYVLNCRIELARKLLLTTDRTVTSIGQELGFYSAQHFALAFKRIVSQYPQEFRRAASSHHTMSMLLCQ